MCGGSTRPHVRRVGGAPRQPASSIRARQPLSVVAASNLDVEREAGRNYRRVVSCVCHGATAHTTAVVCTVMASGRPAHATCCAAAHALQVFDNARWAEHRSTSRYFRYLDKLFTSRIVRGLLGPMAYTASLCTSVGVYHTLLDYHVLQQLAPDVSILEGGGGGGGGGTRGRARQCAR
jgi:hypothetical protein